MILRKAKLNGARFLTDWKVDCHTHGYFRHHRVSDGAKYTQYR
ncbi:hypothetical protein N9030_00010 [bacterium]|nr:hypothetical protein [bacterium]